MILFLKFGSLASSTGFVNPAPQYNRQKNKDDDYKYQGRIICDGEEVGKILIDLTNALGKGHEIVLSEIRGNCYALNIATKQHITYEILKVIHKKVSDNDFAGLNSDQKKYANTLKVVLHKEKAYLDIYTQDKEEYHVKVFDIVIPDKPK